MHGHILRRLAPDQYGNISYGSWGNDGESLSKKTRRERRLDGSFLCRYAVVPLLRIFFAFCLRFMSARSYDLAHLDTDLNWLDERDSDG